MGDYAYSAEELLVWVYETSPQGGLSQGTWIETDQIVPDQVTPASDSIPSNSIINGSVGVSTEYSRGDHQHPLQVSTLLPQQDTATGEVGDANTYARSDHTHHVNLSSSIPLKDTGTGTAGISNVYASATHQRPLNVAPSSVNVPSVNAIVAANGTSDYYCRNDHVHPQQLTYDGNITVTKFIKTGGTSLDILLADGSTKKINNSIGFQVDTKSGFGKLQFNYHWNNGTGISTYQYLFIPSLATVQVFFQGNITDILTTDAQSSLPTDYSSINQLIPNIQGNTQINLTLVEGQGYDDGLRIARTVEITGSSSIELGCSRTSNSGAIQGQWVIYTPSSTATQAPQSFIIAVANQASDDVTRGLQISIDGNTLKFNNKVLVDAGTDQTITGIKTFNKIIQVNPSINGTFNEGIKISRNRNNQWNIIQLGCDSSSNSGYIENQWMIGTIENNGENQLGFTIVNAGQDGQINRGLQISADGNTLTFNGSVIAGTGATNRATNGSVNYSAGNPILWCVNSVDTNGGFYSDGAKVYWRAKPLIMGSVPP
ncbi:MAG: hypothetical protein EZS28_024053 [Streblomastix strix]|uniref:Uncharacterized protein n=1 Tax=Streblomastix strix TaxID=222440 RepID=A0A5J4VD60_9EUKA|nr:MAG: hypothetical protein EZS28_024053 [Streblomastix strix]